MAMNTLTSPVRPAKSAGLNKITARALAGEHRSTNARQQLAIEAVIAADAMERLFTRHPANGCLLAREG